MLRVLQNENVRMMRGSTRHQNLEKLDEMQKICACFFKYKQPLPEYLDEVSSGNTKQKHLRDQKKVCLGDGIGALLDYM
jgi:hypothetical protein